MYRIMNSSLGAPICLVLGLFMIGCGIYYFIKWKKQGKVKQSVFQEVKMDIQAIQRNDALQILKKWFPIMCFFPGIYLIVEFADRTWGGEEIHYVKQILLILIVCGVCLAFGIGGLLNNAMGKETKELEGLVVKVVPNPYAKAYNVWIEYSWYNFKRLHRCTYNYKKEKCPFEGQQYNLIYSTKYDNVLSKDEMRRNKKNSILGFIIFGLFVSLLIVAYI